MAAVARDVKPPADSQEINVRNIRSIGKYMIVVESYAKAGRSLTAKGWRIFIFLAACHIFTLDRN